MQRGVTAEYMAPRVSGCRENQELAKFSCPGVGNFCLYLFFFFFKLKTNPQKLTQKCNLKTTSGKSPEDNSETRNALTSSEELGRLLVGLLCFSEGLTGKNFPLHHILVHIPQRNLLAQMCGDVFERCKKRSRVP